jgi:hypothetical protein
MFELFSVAATIEGSFLHLDPVREKSFDDFLLARRLLVLPYIPSPDPNRTAHAES